LSVGGGSKNRKAGGMRADELPPVDGFDKHYVIEFQLARVNQVDCVLLLRGNNEKSSKEESLT
jgi:hypothetical protein